ncbi:MAG: SUMF1/EgtB/PvdO family nonheme iron enzyme [Bacteroidales bacterium]|nr:SUMF1/EgtB/PvdO family nonheme iron enzyme [Bacteroidales bacterium]
MKKIVFIGLVVAFILSGCGSSYNGELVGVQTKRKYFEPEPLGMVFIPQGSFNIGPSDQDISWAMNSASKTVTVDAFWMDETEITNSEYRQFINYVRDSIIRFKLGEAGVEGFYKVDENGDEYDPPVIDWETKIDMKNEDVKNVIEEMYYPPNERFFGRKQIDPRKLIYAYFWIDLKQAAKTSNSWDYKTQSYHGEVFNQKGEKVPIQDRSSFIFHDQVPCYPDTLVWIRDFTYSYNEPWTNMYFWHPSFYDYPVVGVTWKQANAFSIWRTKYLNDFLAGEGRYFVQEYRLPTETEWEYAARGGLELSMYPWGGIYTRNDKGCFLANFKPLRGNYIDDGALVTNKVGSYEPNEFGLYDMAGNVAEWTSSAYDESAYMFIHDMNPDYKYNARPDESCVMKRKVIRGGSWKDIAFYLQVSTRSYEYQDSSKSFVGFRNVRSYMGTGQ